MQAVCNASSECPKSYYCYHRTPHYHSTSICSLRPCTYDGRIVKCIEHNPKSETTLQSGVDPPNNVPLGQPGCKLDAGKVELSFAIDGFPHALESVSRVGMYGAYDKGYGVNAWQSVENGVKRYREARLRHDAAIAKGENFDRESGLPHAWHSLWNHLAEIELSERDKRG